MFIIIFGLFILACDDSTSPENILILSISFERNGVGSLIGWEIDPELADYSGSTPVDGGSKSLKLISGNTSEGYATKKITANHGDGIYQLSIWGKMSSEQLDSTGKVIFGTVNNGTVTQDKTAYLEDTVWTEITITDTLTFAENDSIYIKLSAGTSETSEVWYSLFDLLQLELIEE